MLPAETRGEEPGSAPYTVGDLLTRIELTDQHGRQGVVDATTGLLVFLPDRAAGKLLHAALENAPPGYLGERRAVCIADISGMPALVARFIALPKMRGYPYPLLLAGSAEASVRLPRRPAAATLLRLDRLRIVSIDFAQTPSALATALAAARRADGRESRPRSKAPGGDNGKGGGP